MSDNSNTGLTFGVDVNVHNSFELGQRQPLLFQKDVAVLSSQQLLTLAGEGIIEAWQNKTDPTQALVYAFAGIFGTNFEPNAQIAFGEKFDIQKAKALGNDILGGNYGVLPDFQFIDSTEINGGYAQSSNTVFFDNLFVSQNAANPNVVGKVLVEELGHRIDAFASPVDSMGDEGKILAKLVNGEKISSAELTSLKAEDDHSVININGLQVTVEMDAVSVTANTLQAAKNIGVLSSTSQTFTGFVGDSGIHNYIKFQVTTPSVFAVELSGLTKDANVRLLNDQGGFIQASYNKGTAIDAFQYQLGVGTHYVHVYREAAGDNTNYSLKISAPPVTPVTNPLPIAPVGSTPISTAPPSVPPGSTSPLGTIDGAGNTQSTARNIGTLTTTQTFNDLVGVNDKEDWYSFYIAEPGTANIAVTSNKGANVEFYKGTSMFSRSSTEGKLTRSEYIYEPGQYFVRIAQNFLDQDSNYSITLSTTSSVVDLGSLSGTRNVAAGNNIAYYRFKLTQNSVVTASSNFPNAVSFDVRDSSYSKTVGSWLNAGTLLNAGTYYLAVSNVPGAVVPASFTLNLQATPTSRYDNAGLNYLTARDLGTLVGSNSVTDYIDRNDKYDYYSFTVGSKSSVSLNVAAITGSATVDISLVNDKYASIGYTFSNAGAAPKPLTATLEAGKYYVRINDTTGTTDVQYRFDVNVQSLVANDAIGNSYDQLKDLGYLAPNTPVTLKDAIGGSDPADWMKFNVSTLGNVSTAFSGLTTPITVQLSRIEANGSLTSISTQNSGGQASWTPVFSNLVGNYALVVSSSNSTSTPYTLNLSTVSINVAPTNVKWNFSGNYQSNQDVIVTGTVSDANGALDLDEARFYLQSKDGSFRQTFSTKNFTQSATDSKAANFSINLGKLPIGQYTYNSDVYDKSRSPANTGTIIYPNGGYAAEVVYVPVNSSIQVASQILPYYSALSSAQQNKLGIPLSANATNTNGSWRQDFQGGFIIAWAGSTPSVYFSDGTKYDLPNSLIQTLPIVGTLTSTGNVSGSLSSSDAKDQFRSAFYDDYALSGFAAGQQVRLTLSGSGFTPQIFLIDAVSGQTQKQSTVIQNGNQTILDFVVPTTGNYRVRVTSGNANQTGSYTLESGSIPVTPPVSSGSTTSFDLVAGASVLNINGYTISGAFSSIYKQYQSTLGNPTSAVKNYSNNISYQYFTNGSIVSSQHGAFALYGAIRQKYLSIGGLNSGLGAPKSNETGLGNGLIRQDFVGGYIIWNGSSAVVKPNDGTFIPVTSVTATKGASGIASGDITTLISIPNGNWSNPKLPIWSSNLYKVVSSDDPLFNQASVKLPDKGASQWFNKTANPFEWFGAINKINLWSSIADTAWVMGYQDASLHFKHYLNNSGTDWNISVDRMLNDMKDFQTKFDEQIKLAQDAVNSYIKSGIISEKLIVDIATDWDLNNGFTAQKSKHPNWFYAMGGFYYRVTNTVTITPSTNSIAVNMTSQIHVYDRYNWDTGKTVSLLGTLTVSDSDLAYFHQIGLAKEYNIFGSSSQNEKSWIVTI